MWIYSQSSGHLWDDAGKLIATGYSGHQEGKNNPDLQAVPSVGPIPRGMYFIGDPYDSDNIGPFALPLDPIDHDCLGRTYFRIHGDSSKHPGEASKGCIVLNRNIREMIHYSNDKTMLVIE